MKTVDDVLEAANREWDHWGKSQWDLVHHTKHIAHRDDEPAFAKYVIAHYNKVAGGSPTPEEIMNDHYFWSAVGMSYVFDQAGFEKTEFPIAQAHSVWIRHFIKARKNNDAHALYFGYRLTEPEAKPDVGDLIGYTFDDVTFDKAQAYFDKTGEFHSHTDLVVEKRAREIDVIGFNVMDSVTKKTIPLTDNGLIGDKSHKWFVVLKRKALH